MARIVKAKLKSSGPDPQGDRRMASTASTLRPAKQLLHLVFGGELKALADVEFQDLSRLDIVGIYGSYAEAHTAWQAAAQRTVDNAHMRYFIVHIHRLLDPTPTA